MCIFGLFEFFQVAVVVCFCIWVIYSIPLMKVSLIMPVPCCFYYYDPILQLKVKCGDTCLSFLFFFINVLGFDQGFLDYQDLLCFHIRVKNNFYFYEKQHWNFYWNYIESIYYLLYDNHFLDINPANEWAWGLYWSTNVFSPVFYFIVDIFQFLGLGLFQLFCSVIIFLFSLFEIII